MNSIPPDDDPDPVPDDPMPDDPIDEAELDRALAASEGGLGAQLRTLLDPDDQLHVRTVKDVDRALRARDTVGAALDLLGLGWWTTSVLLTDDRRPADADREGR